MSRTEISRSESADAEPIQLEWSRLLVEPIALCIGDWLESGKLEESDLDGTLTANARGVVDAGTVGDTWIPLADMESLVAVLANQLGGDPALVEWAQEIFDHWSDEESFAAILEEAGRLVDGAGYAAARLAQTLVRRSEWTYEGGRSRFEIRLSGLSGTSTGLRSLLGALLSGIAERTESGFDDVRFEGVDRGDLAVFGDATDQRSPDRSVYVR